jgi:hypothetical protein
MNPLEKFGPNEPCWCGADKKYKTCHGNHRPSSRPGEPVPPDTAEGGVYISPKVILAKDALTVEPGGAPVIMPTGRPEARPVRIEDLSQRVVTEPPAAPPPSDVKSLGLLRVAVLQQMNEQISRGRPAVDGDLSDAVRSLARATVDVIGSLANADPRPVMLWNDELEPANFVGRTLLIADHILVPDPVFDAVVRDGNSADLKDPVRTLLDLGPMLESGLVIPVPQNVAMAIAGHLSEEITKRDVRNQELTDWVRSQLIIEGPTAREALFMRAIDDTDDHPFHRLLGRFTKDGVDADTGAFTSTLLGRFDPASDYGPWIEQSKNDAVAYFVQRLNERAVTADVFAADYVTASPFEARILRKKGYTFANPAHAAIWADIPLLPDADPKTLAKAASEDDAVEDLRRQIRAALVTARTLDQKVDEVTNIAHAIEAASHALEKKMRSDHVWQAALPIVGGVGTIALGAFGGLPGIGAGAIGTLISLSPYLGSRFNSSRDAAYIYVGVRRAERKRR